MSKPFTGRRMTAILVVAFGVVIAVNLCMAALAIRGFGGVVVENSYVASQRFNTWLEDARHQEHLGWIAEVSRDQTGHLIVTTQSIPREAIATATIRRPLGDPSVVDLPLDRLDNSTFRSIDLLAAGRWIVRLRLESGKDDWAIETVIE